MRLVASLKLFIFIAAAFFCLTAAILLHMGLVPRGEVVASVRFLSDTSDSVGSDLHNRYISAGAELLDQCDGMFVRVVRFGATSETLFAEQINRSNKKAAIGAVLGLELYPKDAAGTDITRTV